MKIFSTLFCLLAFLSSTHGQTITTDWFFGIGDTNEVAVASNADEISAPEGGIDRVWDFSNAIAQFSGPTEYVDPGTMTRADSFPRATVAFGFPGVQELFYNSEGDTLEILGLFSTIPENQLIRYDDHQGEILAVNNMVFGDVFNHFVIGTTSIAAGDFPFEVRQRLTFNGLGTAITPARNTENCINLKTEVLDNDGNVTATVHLIVRDHLKNIIAQHLEQIDPNTGASLYNFGWQTDFSGVSTYDYPELQLSVSNNLTTDVTIGADKELNTQIQLIAMNGQVLKVSQEVLSPGSNLLDYSDSITANGQYILLIMDKDNGSFTTEKISVQDR